MIRLTLLAGYLVVCATWVPWVLSRAAWVSRFPRAAIALWAGLVVAVSAGAVAFGAMTARHVRWHAADLVWGWTRLLDALGGHLVVILCVAGALSAAVVVLRGVIVGTGSLWRLRRGWRDHVDALDLLAAATVASCCRGRSFPHSVGVGLGGGGCVHVVGMLLCCAGGGGVVSGVGGGVTAMALGSVRGG
jgi:hypothetical protein